MAADYAALEARVHELEQQLRQILPGKMDATNYALSLVHEDTRAIRAMQAEQARTLAEQSRALAEQSRTLAEHGRTLDEHGALLREILGRLPER